MHAIACWCFVVLWLIDSVKVSVSIFKLATHGRCLLAHRTNMVMCHITCTTRWLSAGKPQPLQDVSRESEAMHSSYPPEQSLPDQTLLGQLSSIALLGESHLDVTAAAHDIAMHTLKLLRDPL